jgi:hypothetical protein
MFIRDSLVRQSFLLRAASALTPFLVLTLPAPAQRVQVIRELKHAVSPPLRSLASASGPVASANLEDPLEAPEPDRQVAWQDDPVVQKTADTRLAASPGANILGLGAGFTGPQGAFQFSFAPPDPTASVGATQIVETVNLSMAVFDKATLSPILGPISMASLWSGFDASCSATVGLVIADPIVLYDKQASRWVIEIVTMNIPYYSCFAVSTTSDATGSYNLYAFPVQATGRSATPRFGVWPDGYYLSARIYNPYPEYIGPGACAVDRNQMIAGQAATMQCFQIDNTSIDGMLPSDLDGTAAPPAGSPNYYLAQGPAGSHTLYLYKFHVDFATPANSTFTGPVSINVAAYTAAPIGDVVPQLGTNQKLTGLGNCLMHRLAYRYLPNASPPHESLIVTHAVLTGTSTNRRVGVRWYELRRLSTTPAVYQQGTYSPDATYRWMSSAAMDKVGNIAVGYSVSSATIYPGIRYTGRLATDPPGALEAEATIFNGGGYQSGTDRWGDFTSVSVDPADDCTMWYTNQYMAASGSLNWATYLFSFKFPSCQ